MNYRWLVVLVILLVVAPVVGEELDGKVIDEAKVVYESVEVYSENIIESVMQTIGLAPKERKVAVTIGSDVIAVIPTDSVFNGVGITSRCLGLQYGTDEWYKCEKLITERHQRDRRAVKEVL